MSAAPAAAPARPSVFQYIEARRFLADAFAFEKARSPAFSHRYVAQAMGARSSGFFKDILNGRVRLSPARTVKFARLFKLSRPEADHFETLVLYSQAAVPEEKERYLRKMTEGAGTRKHTVLEAFQLEYFKKWHYAAVRELLAIHEFQGDYDRLAGLLDPAITAAEAADAVRLLLKLRLIRKNAQGRFERVDKVISSGTESDPARIRPAIRDNLELALKALDAHPAAARPFSYVTISVSEASVAQIRDRLRKARRDILDIAAQDEKVDRLYQLNFQLFPLSKTVKAAKP